MRVKPYMSKTFKILNREFEVRIDVVNEVVCNKLCIGKDSIDQRKEERKCKYKAGRTYAKSEHAKILVCSM